MPLDSQGQGLGNGAVSTSIEDALAEVAFPRGMGKREPYPSRPINMNRGSPHADVLKAVDEIYVKLVEKGLLGAKKECPLKSHLNVVLCNILHIDNTFPGYWVRYSRSPNRYRHIERYHRFGNSYRHLMSITDALFKYGLVEVKRGFFDHEKEKGKQSLVRPTPLLRREFAQIDEISPQAVSIKYKPELIELRDRRKRAVDYQEADVTNQMRHVVESYNELLGQFSITLFLASPSAERFLEDHPVDFSNTTYRRVFNNKSFEQGGRFYGPWWQNLKKELRPYIVINDEPTCELDYSAIHIHLLYSLEGECYADLFGKDDDPYSIEGNSAETRKVLKTILLIALNSSDESSAIKAMRNELRDGGLYRKGMDLKGLIKSFSDKHEKIRKYIYSGIGLHLQFLDSQVSESVIMKMVDTGVPALNIHDSFIAPQSCAAFLADEMLTSYQKKGFISIPDIKRT
jgi:hypothetical protein